MMRYKIAMAAAGVLVVAGALSGLGLALGLPGAAVARDSTVAPETHADCLSDDDDAMSAAMGEAMDEETYQSMLGHSSEMHPGGQAMGKIHDAMMGAAGHTGGPMDSSDEFMH